MKTKIEKILKSTNNGKKCPYCKFSPGKFRPTMSLARHLVAMHQDKHISKADKIMKLVRKEVGDEVVGAFAELAGTVWGLESHYKVWSDKDMKFFNNKAVEIRNGVLKLLD
jgi:hypothetical protein